MRSRRDAESLDPSALRMREATIAAGILMTYGVGGLGGLYVALTWGRPHRLELAVLFACATAAGVVVSLLPRERIVRSRLREPFFLTWTVLDCILLILGTSADGGTSSPLALVFFMPVVFSSMSYPMRSVIFVGTLSVMSFLAIAVLVGGGSTAFHAAFASVLACTAALSAWQAQNHKRQHEDLADASRSDPLTGCLNRRGFEERGASEIAEMQRRGRSGALLVLDIDHFKPVNDRFGHAAGDELLRWVAETLKASVRSFDAVGRLGGDEFGVLFPHIEPAQARTSAARVEAALRKRAPASVGVALFPEDGSDLEELTRRADVRLYAGRAGRAAASDPGLAPPDISAVLIDQIDAGVIVTDMEGMVLSWNGGAESLYGWTREEAVGRHARELVVPDDEQPARQLAAELRRDARWDGELRVRHKDGSDFTVYVRNRLIMDANGRPTAIVGVAVDISARVAAETELLQSRNYAHAVTESMGEGLFTLDDEGRVTYINPTAEAMLGWDRGELLGRVMHDVIHYRRADGTARSHDDCAIFRAITRNTTERVDEDLFTARNGRGLHVSYTAAPFHTDAGVQGCVVIFRNIAERKRREEERMRDAETLACIDRVEEALSEERFVLYAQPIVDLRSGETVQHELLLRMRERDGRIIPPGAFLPVAEKYALVGEIDRWVIKRAAQLAGAGCPVELNISARSLGDVDVLEHVARSVEQYSVPRGALVFEITETAILEDAAAACEFVEGLHRLGCRIALDDFGTGYAGLMYLKQLPVDFLKIDIEFVRDLISNSASRHVVQAVVALAHDFDLQTVAEGVEDATALEILCDLGVDFAQGDHIARPEPFDGRPGDRGRPTQLHQGALRGARPRHHGGARTIGRPSRQAAR